MSSLQRKVIGRQLPPIPKSNESGLGLVSGRTGGRKRDYAPVSWNNYFDAAEKVKVSEGNVFQVYRTGSSGPLLLLLHGGGYSGLTWALFTASIVELVECQVIAVDFRGHGESSTDDETDLSAETLASDIGGIIATLYEPPSEPPPIVVIGHSMGGAIGVHTVYRDLLPTCIGLVVIDVVEGTALDALQSMQSFLRGRPNSFQSIEGAIEWCLRSGQVRNLESAKVSMPGQLKCKNDSKPATLQLHDSQNDSVTLQAHGVEADSIAEEAEDDLSAQPSQFKTPGEMVLKPYTWRIDLSKTECYWSEWFQGLSNLFLSTAVPKMLLLAGVDRLDRELTIGQMQGKFQMQVLPQCGHAVHEDVPHKVSEAIATFLVRQKFATAKSDFIRAFPAC